ncbi:MAG: single-stranded-DNA-specific exonuclease RecJ [Holosporales bacterium]|jgi:single-stranded-DNA-specific exonuclease|nr:single-stranded-DNA-specific exonuclease RecJ [Holosporales bacterium]
MSQKEWVFLEPDAERLEKIKFCCNIDDIIARILINRKIDTPELVNSFFNSTLRNTIPDPSLILDIDKGVQRLIRAIKSNENVMIFGDYDVDGITSSYIIIKYLKQLGIHPKYYIPNRFSDGYGISLESVKYAISENTELIIALDSGINSINEIEEANKFGIDSIIIDHHLQLCRDLPNAAAVINPNRKDQPEISNAYIKNLCAAGVAFLFLIALRRELRRIDFFHNKPEPRLLDFMDAVSLGTLCDVMEVKGLNRAFIKYFLKMDKYSIGISSIMKAFNMTKITTTEDLLFFIGPAVNAAGRIGDPHIALNLFLAENNDSADKIASKLLEFNEKRKLIEKQLLAEANLIISANNLHDENGICVYGDNWHEGVLGIIAGKIKDNYNRPSFVISFDENGIGKGSARSVEGVHLGDFFDKANEAAIIISGGGHAMAGGFSINKTKVDEFKTFINDNITHNTNQNAIKIDCSMLAQCNLNTLAKKLTELEPFGKGVEKPIFCIKRVKIKLINKIKNGKHISIIFSDEFGKNNIRSVIFNISSKNAIIELINTNQSSLFDIVGELNYSEQFGGNVVIKDIRIANHR